MFDNPYRDPKEAVKIVAEKADWDNARDAHRKSVVLLKNDNVLPLTTEKIIGQKVYVECFNKEEENAQKATADLREKLSKEMELVDDPSNADYAILMVNPSSGNYFNATQGYLELNICENHEVCNVDEQGRPMKETHLETTLIGVARIEKISKQVRDNGGKVIMNVNFSLAWELGNVERFADSLLAGFFTEEDATMDVITGRFMPTGKLPLTLPRGDEALAVNADGVCISPNDVPGFDKDQYMPESLKDENGKAYVYRDTCGNYYELNFGLSYETN